MAKTTKAAKKTVAKKTTAKKTTKKAAPKKAAKKTITKKTTKKKTTKKKDGLRKAQIRILQALKSGKQLTRAQIAEKVGVMSADCTYYVGANDSDVRTANDKKHYPSLISLKLVRIEQHDTDGKVVTYYSITTLGKNKLQ